DHDNTPSLPSEPLDERGLPLFGTPATMGSSVGVSTATDVDTLVAAYRHHPATAQCGLAPSVGPEWSRYARSTLLRRGSGLLDQRNASLVE
ncbi:hypothetical protein, partial [Aeromicrobium sp.]|uniref:hypothetical protein n=1 Tax=Aeromicrobium sp. TaxID=1871063 RepID=UPI003510F1E1